MTHKTPIKVKSVQLDGWPHRFQGGMDGLHAYQAPRAVWTVIMDGTARRIVTTLERGIQEVMR